MVNNCGNIFPAQIAYRCTGETGNGPEIWVAMTIVIVVVGYHSKLGLAAKLTVRWYFFRYIEATQKPPCGSALSKKIRSYIVRSLRARPEINQNQSVYGQTIT